MAYQISQHNSLVNFVPSVVSFSFFFSPQLPSLSLCLSVFILPFKNQTSLNVILYTLAVW